MKEKIAQILAEINSFKAESKEALENYRVKYLSKKGVIPALFADFKQVEPEMRKELGIKLNELKNRAQEIFDEQMSLFENQTTISNDQDLSLPVEMMKGARHPLSIVREEINSIFERLGFVVSEGPEIEDDFHCFSALNFPPDHPARDMQDTFFIGKDPDVLLHTHTSSVKVRVMEQGNLPIRIRFLCSHLP